MNITTKQITPDEIAEAFATEPQASPIPPGIYDWSLLKRHEKQRITIAEKKSRLGNRSVKKTVHTTNQRGALREWRKATGRQKPSYKKAQLPA